jgi:hypothetical protein
MDEFGPEVLMNKLTDLPDDSDQIEGFLSAKARIRRPGMRNLLDAVSDAGAARILDSERRLRLAGRWGRCPRP